MPATAALPHTTTRATPALQRSPVVPYHHHHHHHHPALAHQPFTDGQHLQLRAQILVHADLLQGKPPAEATMVRAFGEPVDDHQHAWEEALRVAVDRVQNQRSPMTGLQTPITSRIGKQGSKDTAAGTVALHDKNSEVISLSKKNAGKNMAEIQKSCFGRSVPNSPRDGNEGGSKEASTVVEMSRVHDKSSEHISPSEKNTGKNMAVIQKSCCNRSVPESPRDGNEGGAKQASNNNITENTVVEMSHVHCSDDGFSGFAADNMPVCTEDKYSSRPIDGLMEGDLCVKCGKHGQLLKCSRCLLAAHDGCFGPSVIFDDSGQFDCPVCLYNAATEAYKKAKEVYFEAWKNFSDFLGPKQLGKQHDEQYTRKQQRAANGYNHLNEYNTSKRQGNRQSKADSLCLSHKYEETGQQKVNSTSDACPEEVVTEKTSFGPDSDAAPMSKHSILQNSRNQVYIAEHEPPMEKADTHEEYGNINSSHVAHTSQNRCSPAANRHHKVRFQEKGRVVSNSSKKASGCQDQHTPSLLRKRCYMHQLNCNPVTPTRRPAAPIRIHPAAVRTPLASTVRRARVFWTEEEETALREAVEKFAPKDKTRQISWVQILEYGRDVFHKARRADDLKAKWNYMMNKKKKCCPCGLEGSGVV